VQTTLVSPLVECTLLKTFGVAMSKDRQLKKPESVARGTRREEVQDV